MGDVRRRGPTGQLTNGKSNNHGSTDSSSSSENKRMQYLDFVYWGVVFIFISLGYIVGVSYQESCEESVLHWGPGPSSFDESNARIFLKDMTQVGQKMVGSPENEIIIPKYLKSKLEKYANKRFGPLWTALDVQISEQGSFPITILAPNNNLMSVYSGVQNTIFRIYSSDPSNTKTDRSAVLVNCHYDTFSGSPGAADDCVSCSVMLEAIRVILDVQPILAHDIIFLFNGAEENLLQASHAFVSQHKWAKDAKVLINLDGAGSGGRQLVFQVSPESMWILEEYTRAARLPFVTVVGQEVFQSGLIPSDTDFRIFRDFGNITGIDFAYINNGYVYHTSLDEEKRIPPSCMKTAGDNVVALILALANSSISRSRIAQQDYPVFFDVFGITVIQIDRLFFTILNSIVVLIILYQCYSDIKFKQYNLKMFVAASISQTCFFIGLLLLSVSIGTAIHFFGQRMSWYAFRFNIVGLFILPLISYCCFYHSKVSNLFYKWPTPYAAERCHFQATNLGLSFAVVLGSLAGSMSVYLIFIWVFPAFIGDILLRKIHGSRYIYAPGWPSQIFYAFRTIIHFGFSFTYSAYATHLLFEVFIPIMGRAGTDVLPDIFVGVLVIVAITFPSLYISLHVYRTKALTAKKMGQLFFNCFISYLLIVHLTQLGFPYNTSETSPRRQRVVMAHTNRIFRTVTGEIRHKDSSLLITTMDQNRFHLLAPYLPETTQDEFKAKCERLPYCGCPHYYPVSMFFNQSYYLPRPPHNLSPGPELKLLTRSRIGSTETWNLTFSVTGPSHTHIFIMTEPGVDLIGWSFGLDKPRVTPVPRDTPEKHYFVYYSYGRQPSTPLQFWLKLNIAPDLPQDKQVIDIALSAVYLYGDILTPVLRTIIESLPKWVTTSHWASTYSHYIFPVSH